MEPLPDIFAPPPQQKVARPPAKQYELEKEIAAARETLNVPAGDPLKPAFNVPAYPMQKYTGATVRAAARRRTLGRVRAPPPPPKKGPRASKPRGGARRVPSQVDSEPMRAPTKGAAPKP